MTATLKFIVSNDLQAAAGLANFKMGDSPVKKLNFEPVKKENVPFNGPAVDDLVLKKPLIDTIEKEEKPAVVPTVKDLEANEPLLQENPHRFVLFPIRYNEVCIGRVTRKVVSRI